MSLPKNYETFLLGRHPPQTRLDRPLPLRALGFDPSGRRHVCHAPEFPIQCQRARSAHPGVFDLHHPSAGDFCIDLHLEPSAGLSDYKGSGVKTCLDMAWVAMRSALSEYAMIPSYRPTLSKEECLRIVGRLEENLP